MKYTFHICTFYSVLGFFYNPSFYSFLSFLFVTISTFPFLFANNEKDYHNKYIKYQKINYFMFFLLIALGFFNCYLIIKDTGANLFDALSIDGLYKISQSSTDSRYGYESSSGSPTILATSLLLIFILSYDNRKERLFALGFSFVPPVLVTVLTTAK